MCADRCYPHRTRCCLACADLEVQTNFQVDAGLTFSIVQPEVAIAGTGWSVMPAPEPTCAFPDCRYDARPDHPTCELHQNVTVTGSWVESAKHEDDGGS